MNQPIGPFSSVFLERIRGPFNPYRFVWIPMPCGANVVLSESEFNDLYESGSFVNIIYQEASDGETTAATAVGTDADGILSCEFE